MTMKEILSFLHERRSTGCLEWRGSLSPSRYGVVWYEKKSWRVHRLIWTMRNGPIPSGMVICHRCDNRQCANIQHLFLGTIEDNNRDMTLKGRSAAGEAHHKAKISDEAVRQIRDAYVPFTTTAKQLAESFGITERHVFYILSGEFRKRARAFPNPDLELDKRADR